ncbi:MAG: molybdopterin-dependent oxidoreductase [Halobacteriales archaeon]
MSGTRLLEPAAVDWAILASLVAALATGAVGLVTGRPGGAWVIDAHAVAGVVLAGLLVLKLRRVADWITPRRLNRTRAASVTLAVVAVGAVGTGIAWTFGATLPVAFWTLLNVHILLGLAVAALAGWHLRARLRSRQSLARQANRRTAIRYLGLVVGGALIWRIQQTVAVARRFTGSREEGSDDGNRFPVTSWVANDPDPLDVDGWTLQVGGRTDRTLELALSDLDAGAAPGGAAADDGASNAGAGNDAGDTSRGGDVETGGADGPHAALRATLDCTSGWYSVHDWGGVRVGDLLDAAGVGEDAAWVQFRSVTGYRWSLPLAEARDAVLATRVDGAPLAHGHGRPVRLVAPGRRGFQWVKWVDRVVVTRRRDRSEWVAIFVSGIEE